MDIHDQDTFRRGKNEGIQQAKIETARNMFRDKMDLTIIEKYTGLSKEILVNLFQNKKT